MTPRDRLQRLLFEHRTAHDPASSEREILRMFDELQKPREQTVDADGGVPSEMDNAELTGALTPEEEDEAQAMNDLAPEP